MHADTDTGADVTARALARVEAARGRADAATPGPWAGGVNNITADYARSLREDELYRETTASVVKMADSVGVRPDFRRMWFDAESDLDDLRTATDAELARLRAIEAAAREVLSSGQARYHLFGQYFTLEGDQGRWVGDLVPAAAMVALRAAVEYIVAYDAWEDAATESPMLSARDKLRAAIRAAGEATP